MSLVWYACYSSNLLYERFLSYIEGGKSCGSDLKNFGCVDKSEPVDERAVMIKQKMFFAKKSIAWQKKGIAFCDLEKNDKAQTWGRMYLITKEQFEDVFKQESRKKDLEIDWDEIDKNSSFSISGSIYNTVLKIEERDNIPVLMITTNDKSIKGETASPSEKHITTIIEGLHETYGLGKNAIAAYLSEIPGVKGSYSKNKIIKIWEEIVL